MMSNVGLNGAALRAKEMTPLLASRHIQQARDEQTEKSFESNTNANNVHWSSVPRSIDPTAPNPSVKLRDQWTPRGGTERAIQKASPRKIVWLIMHYKHRVHQNTPYARASRMTESLILLVIIINVLVAMVCSYDVIHSEQEQLGSWYIYFMYFSAVLFTSEYVLRLWSCVEDKPRKNKAGKRISSARRRLAWMLQPLPLLDLFCLLPYFIDIVVNFIKTQSDSNYTIFHGAMTIRALRLLRLVSLFRLEGQYHAFRRLKKVFLHKQSELAVLVYLVALSVVTSSITIFFLEYEAQPEVFSSVPVCAWWTIVTITSLGYGDMVPKTGYGRAFASFVAFFGNILFCIPAGIVSSGFVEIMMDAQAERELEEKEFLARLLEADVAAGGPTSPLSTRSAVSQLRAIHWKSLSPQAIDSADSSDSSPTSLEKAFQRRTNAKHALYPDKRRLSFKVGSPNASERTGASTPFSEPLDSHSMVHRAGGQKKETTLASLEQKIDLLLTRQTIHELHLDIARSRINKILQLLERYYQSDIESVDTTD